MKTLAQLTCTDAPAIDLIRQWSESAANQCEILPPSTEREQVLLEVQVSTHSTMGAVAYETGGVLVDHGWLRFLGSGHPKLLRTLPAWNSDQKQGFYLIADDAAGGFFAMNGGALDGERGKICYWPPDTLEWEALDIGYTDFLHWAFKGNLLSFYEDLRWPTWRDDIGMLGGDRCFSFYPCLWTSEGSPEGSGRRPIPIQEAFDLKVDILRQLESQS